MSIERGLQYPYDVFPSPEWVGHLLIEAAEITPKITCLETSAGLGHLACALRNAGAEVFCIEPILDYQTLLTLQGFKVIGQDFLTHTHLENRFERIVQNPPFSLQISFVKKAFKCLKPQGKLVSLMSEYPWISSSSKYQQFRAWCQSVNAIHQELP
ncbi:MAG: hypothetical protein ACRDEA_13925, partial [Microcystaceae cyanobacterium]